MLVSANSNVQDWLDRLEKALSTSGDVKGLFTEDCFWRDLIALTWNLKSVEKKEGIAEMLAFCLPHTKPSSFRRDGDATLSSDDIIEC